MNPNRKERTFLCSKCFTDHGLMLNAFQIGTEDETRCPSCGKTDGRKLDKAQLFDLAYQFFVRGTFHRTNYGGAPVIQFNEHQRTTVSFSKRLQADAKLIEATIGIGFFFYGPRLWMVGEVEPLRSLQNPAEREQVIDRIFKQYPTRTLSPSDLFYRIRKNPENPQDKLEYDSPPNALVGKGRLDSVDSPVLYASQDLEMCIHECRVTVDDLIYAATLTPSRQVQVLDLTELLDEEQTEFESLDMAVHMLFLAGEHSYPISRHLSKLSAMRGLDGIVYPSFFSLVVTGDIPFETVYGLSIRQFQSLSDRIRAQTIRNLAFFGRPISSGKINVDCINRVVINQVSYDISFGPVEY